MSVFPFAKKTPPSEEELRNEHAQTDETLLFDYQLTHIPIIPHVYPWRAIATAAHAHRTQDRTNDM